VVLGAGGTAQAALAALRELGEERPTVVVRDPGRARPLLATAERLGVRVTLRGWGPDALTGADVVVATVPKGAADALARGRWTGGVLFDVGYDPWPTPLAAWAQAAGGAVVSGLDLLLHQAGHQVRLMTGRPAPLAAMRSALYARAPSPG
jgi:shikimate dehydrogenase